jgi:hypothetical protein
MYEPERRARLIEIIRASPSLMRALVYARKLDLPDWRLVSGAVYQRVWNALTGRDPDYGIKDYDLCYFDPDTGWDAEDAVIKHASAVFPPDLSGLVEVRNQGRAHLWFEAKFGEPYTPLRHTDEMLERFVCPAFSVGVRLSWDDQIEVATPFGLEDCFAMRLRPNPRRQIPRAQFAKVAEGCRLRWPELTVL